MLIGFHMELSALLRMKETVKQIMLSQLLVLLKEPTIFGTEMLLNFLFNKLLIVQVDMETTVAQMEEWTILSFMLEIEVLIYGQTIHGLDIYNHANQLQEYSELEDTVMQQDVQLFKVLF